MRRQLLPALRTLAVLTVLCGVVFPALVTVIAQVAFADKAEGSLVRAADGTVVGSELIGQAFTGEQWFHGRPSAAGDGYDPTASAASNLGPTNPDLLDEVTVRAKTYRAENGLAKDVEVPVDALTSSGSGLDPQISVANARLQAPRVARARGLSRERMLGLIDEHTTGRSLGFLGEPGVNVVGLNLAVAAAAP